CGDCTPGSGGTIRAESSLPGIRELTATTPLQLPRCRTNQPSPTENIDAEVHHRARDPECGCALSGGAKRNLAEVVRGPTGARSEHSVGAELRDRGQDHLRLHRAQRRDHSRARQTWWV